MILPAIWQNWKKTILSRNIGVCKSIDTWVHCEHFVCYAFKQALSSASVRASDNSDEGGSPRSLVDTKH